MFAKKLCSDDGSIQAIANLTSSSSEYKISDYGYGKNNVKILHVTRNGPVHSIREFEVNTHLKLYSHKDYLQAYKDPRPAPSNVLKKRTPALYHAGLPKKRPASKTDGDNSDIIATDSQKNTVYVLAQKYGIKTPEEFALLLSSHFLSKYRHVKEAHVHVVEYPWERLGQQETSNGVGKQKHNHAFVFTPVATRFCDVLQKRNGKPTVISGLKEMRVLKTTQSSFVNFVKDEFRTLPDQHDRIFSTIVESRWEYSELDGVDFCKCYNKIKDIILNAFAGDPFVGVSSPSVQNTLYVAEKTVLDQIPQVGAISIQMPNKHYLNFDTKPFEKLVSGDNNSVFVPIDKPSGIIYAQLDRSNMKSKL